eukprot:gb/GEZN01013631.1/.p1 GENE.gb/GEZN01013631.1/~~gb/GEZN01013631.1/.p1  ORF type:complete len:249 (+),score=52.83 gb/GEZN01013631.1/:2-748(+)
MSSSSLPVCVVVGAGPGLGSSVAAKFAQKGYVVALLTRTEASAKDALDRIAKEKGKAQWFQMDVGDEKAVSQCFQQIKQALGEVSVLVFNIGASPDFKKLLEVKREDMAKQLNNVVLGFLACTQQVLPAMIVKKQGSILVTSATAAFRGSATFPSFSATAFAIRSLCQSLSKAYAKEGVHCCLFRIDGMLNTPGVRTMVEKWKGKPADVEMLTNTDDTAEMYWSVHQQSKHAWTNELDIRPYTEEWTY